MVARHVAVLVAITLGVTAVHSKSPTISSAFHHGDPVPQSEKLPDTGSVRIQSTSTASQTPPCNSDAACQALCPTEDITVEQPALSTAQLQQQAR